MFSSVEIQRVGNDDGHQQQRQPPPGEGMRRRPPGPPACGAQLVGATPGSCSHHHRSCPGRSWPDLAGLDPVSGPPLIDRCTHPPRANSTRQCSCRQQRTHVDSSSAPRASHSRQRGTVPYTDPAFGRRQKPESILFYARYLALLGRSTFAPGRGSSERRTPPPTSHCLPTYPTAQHLPCRSGPGTAPSSCPSTRPSRTPSRRGLPAAQPGPPRPPRPTDTPPG
jgi:hypothetical protein